MSTVNTNDPKVQEMFRFLDSLREGGSVNMFGASVPLREAYPDLSRRDAQQVVVAWMESFDERHPEG